MKKIIFRPRWIFTTILVLIGVGILIRLGIWQLDRLEWRRSFNTHYLQQVNAPPVNLNSFNNEQMLTEMEYRQAILVGSYIHEKEVYLRNQAWENQPGYHILTPFVLDDTGRTILVDRGWVPLSNPWENEKIDRPIGKIELSGIIRLSQDTNDFGFVPEGDDKNNGGIFLQIVSLKEIEKRQSLSLLPVYIQIEKTDSQTDFPVVVLPEIEITEGPHFGYAMQWFFFASLLGIGYPFYLRKVAISENLENKEQKDEGWQK